MDSRDSSHSRERSAEKTEKTHKGSKKQKYVSPCSLIQTPEWGLLSAPSGLYTRVSFRVRDDSSLFFDIL